MRWALLSLVVAMVPLTGCITMAGDQLSDVTPNPGTLTPSIEQTVGDFSFHLDGGKMVTSNYIGRDLNKKILGRWKKSGFITDHEYVKLSRFSKSSVYRLTLSGYQEGESSILLQIVSGLSLTIIPYYVNAQMDLHYSIENSETGCVFEATASDSYNTVVGLLLLPATPFAQGGSNRTFDRIANNLYAQLAASGAFEKHASCRESGAPKPTTAERLRELERLRTDRLISESEYQRKRDEILRGL